VGAVVAGYLCLHRRSEQADVATGLAALIIVSSPPLVIWALSGLENALYGLLVALMVLAHLRAHEASAPVRPWVALGLAAFLLAVTRPEGILFALAPAVTLGLAARANREAARRSARRFLCFSAGLSVPLATFLLLRKAYFGAWLPNTFWAKDADSAAVDLERLIRLDLSVIQKVHHLAAATLGPWAVWILVLAVWWSFRSKTIGLWWLYAGISALAFVLLPKDWMLEMRFGTPFVVTTAFAIASVAMSSVAALRPMRRIVAGALMAAVLASMLLSFRPRVDAFARDPVVPAQAVARIFGQEFHHLSEILDVPEETPSVLLPDIGAVLYCDAKLRVIDLAGLADRVLARASDQSAAHRYIFEDIRPTFVHSHPPWGERLDLLRQPEFARWYTPLYVVGEEGKIRWGHWVRRDIADGFPETVRRIRARLEMARPEQGVPWRNGEFCGD
jgi:hypothetical protein